jgi:hypothetical protein
MPERKRGGLAAGWKSQVYSNSLQWGRVDWGSEDEVDGDDGVTDVEGQGCDGGGDADRGATAMTAPVRF